MKKSIILTRVMAILMTVGLAGFATVASATHSWGGYHWARTANPFTPKVGNNLSATWSGNLDTSISDWSQSAVLDLTKVAGGAKTAKRCNPTLGRDEVCNAAYGNNGWLGVAQIWISGLHITQGTVKVNDTYFNTSTYNSSAWRNLVMCQEVGHTLGLDHQDTNFNNANLGTCMDYTNDPSTNQHPNKHDYDELDIIYGHFDTTTTVGQSVTSRGNGADLEDAQGWGKEIHRSADGHVSEFVRDLGLGQKIVTHVIWAE